MPSPGSSPSAPRRTLNGAPTYAPSRVKGVKGELEKQLAGVTVERDSLNVRLAAIQIDQAVVTESG